MRNSRQKVTLINLKKFFFGINRLGIGSSTEHKRYGKGSSVCGESGELYLFPTARLEPLILIYFFQNLLSLFNSSKKGRDILASYETFGRLTSARRTDLMVCIVEYFYSHSVLLQYVECQTVAEKIIELFPTENLDTYIQKSVKGKTCRGKLYAKSQNFLSKIKKNGFNIFDVNK
jgi:hypothetical protein